MARPALRERRYTPEQAPSPPTRERGSQTGRTRVDAWMDVEIKFMGSRVKRKTFALLLLGLPGLAPLYFMLPPLIDLNSNTFAVAVDDVLGTGAEACLFLCLLVTPMVTLTGQRWFVPLRRWYGIMMACSALGDAISASITDNFAGGVIGRVAGHTFTLAGLFMVMLVIPVVLTSNPWAQKKLGRYWKSLQRLTYVIWAVLAVHLATLEGFGVQHGANGSGHPTDHVPVLHQRLYQYLGCSAFLLVLRLPPVRRWIAAKYEAGQQRTVWLTLVPLAILFILAFAYILNEEIFKGIDAFTNHPSDE